MARKPIWKRFFLVTAVFAACWFLPVEKARFAAAVVEALALVRWYARQHVLLCLAPAFFIAGAISVFVRRASVMKYLGAGANKFLAYGVASISGTVLAVCSCTVLPLFAGIYRMGAGLGPAVAFLYSGPAINVLAIILTARILGLEIGIARAVAAIAFSILVGLSMHLIFRGEEGAKAAAAAIPEEEPKRSLRQEVLYFAAMVGILVFANWARGGDIRAVFLCCPGGLSTYKVEGTIVEQSAEIVRIRDGSGQVHEIAADLITSMGEVEKNPVYEAIYRFRWVIVALLLIGFGLMLRAWFSRGELTEWVEASWGFAWQILPLLLAGILLAGFLFGRPGQEGLIPVEWVNAALGGNSIRANLLAAVVGAFMYFATLTEVPILQGLMGAGMGKGPALALLLAGPALSLPSILVIRSVIGTKKTLVFVALVILMATLSGILFGYVRG